MKVYVNKTRINVNDTEEQKSSCKMHQQFARMASRQAGHVEIV